MTVIPFAVYPFQFMRERKVKRHKICTIKLIKQLCFCQNCNSKQFFQKSECSSEPNVCSFLTDI